MEKIDIFGIIFLGIFVLSGFSVVLYDINNQINRNRDTSQVSIFGVVSEETQKDIREHFKQFNPQLDVSMDSITYTVLPNESNDCADLVLGMTSFYDLAIGYLVTYFYCEIQFDENIHIDSIENLTASLSFSDNHTYETVLLIFQFYELNHLNFVFTIETNEIITILGFD